MQGERNRITVFEHQPLWTHKGERRLSPNQLKELQAHYGEKGVPYYSLIHKGVKFNEFVGVIQIGNTTIEVLPKANQNSSKKDWREALIGMLLAVNGLDIKYSSTSELRIRSNSILEVYFELFIAEVEKLLHQGLTKKYRKVEGNRKALKGAIRFSKHFQHNYIHKERFFVRHTTYDTIHLIHSILYKTLGLISTMNPNPKLVSRLGNLSLNFPEMPDIQTSESLFQRVIFNRKTEPYKQSIEIARLLLLNYHPDIISGSNHVLALMFDMNRLWEQFVYASLVRHKPRGMVIFSQASKLFWRSNTGRKSRMKPDLVLKSNEKDWTWVLDTKWKNLRGYSPTPNDLRQMYAYLKYHSAKKVSLVFPGENMELVSGRYYHEDSTGLSGQECSLLSIAVDYDIREWQKGIWEQVENWMENS